MSLGLGTHGVSQAQGVTRFGDTRGQARLRVSLGLGTHGVRPGSRCPPAPPEPPDPPEEVVGDLEVTDGSLHEEAHQGTVQVALVLQGLHRGQCHSATVSQGHGGTSVAHPGATTHLDQLGQVIQQLCVRDGIDPLHGRPPHLLVREPAARTRPWGDSVLPPRQGCPHSPSGVAYVACSSPRASWWLMEPQWLSRA